MCLVGPIPFSDASCAAAALSYVTLYLPGPDSMCEPTLYAWNLIPLIPFYGFRTDSRQRFKTLFHPATLTSLA